ELFYPVRGVLTKAPAETWAAYGPLFRAHATPTMTAQLLAAPAHVEAAGNPLATPEWRWRLTARPFQVYRPASTAVGMLQITEGTFAERKHSRMQHHCVGA